MESSCFAVIPPEVRGLIYEYALHVNTSKGVYFRDVDPKACCGRYLALTRTCRQIYNETRGIFFAINRFTFQTDFIQWMQMRRTSDWNPTSAANANSDRNFPPTARKRSHNVVEAVHRWLAEIGLDSTKALKHTTIDLGTFEGYHFLELTMWMRTVGEAMQHLPLPREVIHVTASYTSHGFELCLPDVPLEPDEVRMFDAVQRALDEKECAAQFLGSLGDVQGEVAKSQFKRCVAAVAA